MGKPAFSEGSIVLNAGDMSACTVLLSNRTFILQPINQEISKDM